MRRTVLALDRVTALVLGLILLVVGAAAADWYGGGLHRLWSKVPTRLSTARAAHFLYTGWWPWAAAGIGTLAVLLGLWWLIAHLPRRRVGMLVLPGSGKRGRLLVDPSGLASTAADVLADAPGIRSAHSKVLRDRGELVIALTGTIDPRADLTEVVAAADDVAAQLHTVLGRDDARARIHLTVARRARPQPRVH
ncbi:MAG TPA: hypothetical protein VGX23_15105 [Actinocrinis sp.]|nr:hypothetical protein [Actinocrinis sp.]